MNMEHRIEPPVGSSLRRLAAPISVALASFLIGSGAAAAATAPIMPTPGPDHGGLTPAEAEPEEEVEWEWSEEEEEEVEWPFEEGEEEIEVELEFEEKARLAPNGSAQTTECVVQSASARVVASDVSDALHLRLRYASREPVRVAVHYSVEGTQKAAHLDPMTLPATRHGTIDYTERPGGRRMSKLRAAHALFVTIEASDAPRSCRRYSTRRLTHKERRPTRTVWSEARSRPRIRR